MKYVCASELGENTGGGDVHVFKVRKNELTQKIAFNLSKTLSTIDLKCLLLFLDALIRNTASQ